MCQKQVDQYYLNMNSEIFFRTMIPLNQSETKFIIVGITTYDLSSILQIKTNQNQYISLTKQQWNQVLNNKDHILNYLNNITNNLEDITIEGDVRISSHDYYNKRIIKFSTSNCAVYLADGTIQKMFDIRKIIDVQFSILESLNINGFMQMVRNKFQNEKNAQAQFGNWYPYISSIISQEKNPMLKKFLLELFINHPAIIEKTLQSSCTSLNYYLEY